MVKKTKQFNYENKEYLDHLNQKEQLWYQDVLDRVNAQQPKAVLELGCGDGAFSKLLGDAGYETLSVDHSATFLQHARKHNKTPNNKFLQRDLNKVDFKGLGDERELIVMIDVLEHLYPREEVLAEINNRLRVGGVFVLQCPNLYCNLVSTNYQHSFKNMCIKVGRGLAGWFRYLFRRPPKQITELKEGLDYSFADHDAVVLTSPFWLLCYFKKTGWKIKSFTSFSVDSGSRLVKSFWRVVGFFPFVRYLGGKMIFVVEKR